jgi:hypothetical protein
MTIFTANRFIVAAFCICLPFLLAADCIPPSVTTQPNDATTCSGGNASFTVVATGTNITYQWQVNIGSGFTNISNNAVYSGATTDVLTITGANSTYSGFLYKCIIIGDCGGIATNNKTLTVTPNTWVGGTSSDWQTPANWSCGVVPTNHDDIEVSPTLGMPSPVIGSGLQAYCRNLTKGGHFLRTLDASGATLTIEGNFTFTNGSFTTNGSSLILMNGTARQYITGGAGLVLSNLTINNSNDVVCEKNITVTSTLKLNAGKLILGDNLLVVNTVSSNTETRYIATCDESNNPTTSGGVRKTLTTGSGFTFPIGPTLTQYSPVTITNSAGPSEAFTVFVAATLLAGANTNETVNRTWTITETTSGGNTADIKVQWDAVDEGSTFSRNGCAVLKTNGSAIDYTGYTIQKGAAATEGGTAWSKTVTGVTAFSPWGVTSQSNLLPITLLDFKVEKNNAQSAVVSWEITANSTPVGFEVLRSFDGKHYEQISHLKAHSDLRYQYLDEGLRQGIHYYKLRMIDQTAPVEYSKVIALDNTDPSAQMTLGLKSNRIAHQAVIDLKNADKTPMKTIKIVNTQGQVFKIWHNTNVTDGLVLDVSDLSVGLYFLHFVTEGGYVVSHRFLKE